MNVISWSQLNEYIAKALPAKLPIGEKNNFFLIVSESARSLSVRLPSSSSESLTLSAYEDITFEKCADGDITYIVMSVNEKVLFQTFYHYCLEVVNLMEDRNLAASAAIDECVSKWNQLLQEKELLSTSSQIGLCGELYFLEILISRYGDSAIESWIGPNSDRHDFRLSGMEIEVKSTLSERRSHVINGFNQLASTPDSDLYLLSIQFASAGTSAKGLSLPDRINNIRSTIQSSATATLKFNENLEKARYIDLDAPHYPDRFLLRTPPTLTLVNSDFPRLVPTQLRNSMCIESLNRIEHVEYRINVDGLGFSADDAEFFEILDKNK